MLFFALRVWLWGSRSSGEMVIWMKWLPFRAEFDSEFQFAWQRISISSVVRFCVGMVMVPFHSGF